MIRPSAHVRPQKIKDEPRIVQDRGLLGHFSKSDIRYWQQSIFRQTYTRNGQMQVTKDWAMKIAHKGRRETFPLGTPNKAAAAARARDIYLSLVVNGWDATLAKFKKPSAARRALNAGQPCTIGEFLEAIARTTTNQGTLEDYARAFVKLSPKHSASRTTN
jgi:hypothetical protein